MTRLLWNGIIGFGMLVLCACSPALTPLPVATTASIEATANATVTSAPTPTPEGLLETAVAPTAAADTSSEAASFSLAEPGPYLAGNIAIKLVDENRGGREISVTIWYPALSHQDANGRQIPRDAPPDSSSAPYPLILTEISSGGAVFHNHLASHGFVMAQILIPDHDEYFNWDFHMIDWPRDFVFVLDQIAAAPPAGLEGMIDASRAGVTGYSYGGDIALTLSGVRIDPEYYLSHCAQPPPIETSRGAEFYLRYSCDLAQKWDAFAAFAGDTLTTSGDGLWQPVTDARIRAVLPMAPSGAWLYGERGLAAADRPVLMIAATEDEFSPYSIETAFILEHLGTPQRSMVSFIEKTHMMVLDNDVAQRLKHFTVAFFGYHLQGRADYARLFSQDFVAQFNDLYWGVYPGE